MKLDDVQIEGIIAWTNDPFIRGTHETAHIAKCLPDTIRALATEALESRAALENAQIGVSVSAHNAALAAKDARIAELEAALPLIRGAVVLPNGLIGVSSEVGGGFLLKLHFEDLESLGTHLAAIRTAIRALSPREAGE